MFDPNQQPAGGQQPPSPYDPSQAVPPQQVPGQQPAPGQYPQQGYPQDPAQGYPQAGYPQAGYPSAQPSAQPMYAQPATGTKPGNSMGLAIAGTIVGMFGCIGMILGIIAIVFASQVNNKWAMGDAAGANDSARKAKILGIIALVLGIIGIGLIILSIVVAINSPTSSYPY